MALATAPQNEVGAKPLEIFLKSFVAIKNYLYLCIEYRNTFLLKTK